MWRLCAILWLGFALPAAAGQRCEAQRPSAAVMARDLELAAHVARELDELARREDFEAVLIARAGQDLSRYGLRWSHLGIAYRDPAALAGRGAWRVVHKLNACGSDRSSLHRHGLAQFFADGLHRHVAGIAVLSGLPPGSAAWLADNARIERLFEPRYNMVAYPWAGPYQQSNQWAIETLAALADPRVGSRRAARDWLRRQGYRAGVVHVGAAERLGARLTTAHISFDDHPLGARLAGHIETVTVDSIFTWLPSSGWGRAPIELGLPAPRRAPSADATRV